MNMIDIKHFTRTPVERAAKLNIGYSIKLLTYKRDRKVVITKVDTNSYKVTESGFEDKEFQSVTINELSKLLSEHLVDK